MKTLELRNLLHNKKVNVKISDEIEEVFKIWIKKRNYDVELLEIFYAGYVLSNPIIREEYIKADKIINSKS